MATVTTTNVNISMIHENIPYRVLYADVDTMGYLHHSKYAVIFEYARWEAFRRKGISYKSIEETGIMMPVVALSVQYLKPVFYDDLLTIQVNVTPISGAKIAFDYKIFNQDAVLVNTGQTTLAFIHTNTRKPMRIPEFVKSIMVLDSPAM